MLTTPKPITKSKIILVEGRDELNLFNELLADQKLADAIEVMEVGGKEKFMTNLRALPNRSGYKNVASLGIVRDADANPESAFQSICSVLENVKLPVPLAPLQPKHGRPQVTVMIIPHDKPGMLEDICLDSVSDDLAMDCVAQYFQCLQEKQRILAANDIPKARVSAFLASREWLEIAHFEYLQKCMASYEPLPPVSPAVSVPKIHAFLASRYTPDLSLGNAAKKTAREDRYWQFNHPAFDKIKEFLRLL